MNLTCLYLLKYIPTLGEAQYSSIVKKYNLVRSVRLLARFLPKTLDHAVKRALGYDESFLLTHKAHLKETRTVNQLMPSEMNLTLIRFAFLALVKASNTYYPPGSKKTMVDGVYLMENRYSEEAILKVYGVTFVPWISSADKNLVKRLFGHHHVKYSFSYSEQC